LFSHFLTGQAGALDEDAFIRQFEDVPTLQLFSAKDLDENMAQLRAIIEDTNKDWAKRVEAVRIAIFLNIRVVKTPFCLAQES